MQPSNDQILKSSSIVIFWGHQFTTSKERYFAKSIEKHYLSQKFTLLKSDGYNQRLDIWVEQQLSKGKYGFALENLRAVFSEHSDTAIKSALKRLSDKRKVISIYKGYYLIIPPQYSSKGILPPAVFLDAFMEFLRRPYYLGLLSAAAYHGASHQQPQEFFVVTGFPVLRPTHKRGLKLN